MMNEMELRIVIASLKDEKLRKILFALKNRIEDLELKTENIEDDIDFFKKVIK